jgi:hypothetical protein
MSVVTHPSTTKTPQMLHQHHYIVSLEVGQRLGIEQVDVIVYTS